MSKSSLFCLALLLPLAPSLLYAQNSDGSQTSGGQSTSTSDCIQDPSGATEGCNSGQTNAQSPTPPSYPVRPNLRTGAGDSENSSLGGSSSLGGNSQLGGKGREGRVEVPALPPDPPSEFQKLVAATTGQFLPIYGADLFRNVPSTFAPIDLAPVTSNYVLGPDDQLFEFTESAG